MVSNIIFRCRQESHDNKELEAIKEGNSPTDESIVPSIYLETDMKLSPFTSNDSLANDARYVMLYKTKIRFYILSQTV